MSQFERLLVPGCTESPACQCGEAMDVATIEILLKEATQLSGYTDATGVIVRCA